MFLCFCLFFQPPMHLPDIHLTTKQPGNSWLQTHCQTAQKQQQKKNSNKTNKQTNQQRHQHSGPPEAASGIDPSSGTETGDKMDEGVGWGVDSKVLKERQIPGSESTSLPSELNHQSRHSSFQTSLGQCPKVHASWTFPFKGNIPCKGRMNSNILIISKTN